MGFCVKDYIQKIPLYFDSSKAGNRSMTIVYKFHDSGENNGAYTVRIANGKCSVEVGEAAEYSLKMLTTAEFYERIVFGKMDFDLIYWTGAMLYFGENLCFREMQTFLNIPENTGINLL